MIDEPKVQPAVEPWMRGTHADLDPVRRGVLHALELAAEGVARWCANLSDEEMFRRPHGIAPAAFHLRHIVRSLDRLLTYADGVPLSVAKLKLLAAESDAGRADDVREEFSAGIEGAQQRVLRFDPATYTEVRGVGRKLLPTTVGGLLIHCAEHTSRHVGQAITTAKIVITADKQSE